MTEPHRDVIADAIAEPSRYQLAADQAHAYLNRGTAEYAPEALRWMVQGLLVLEPAALQILVIWLRGNERRIATGLDDLGLLRGVFTQVMGREPGA